MSLSAAAAVRGTVTGTGTIRIMMAGHWPQPEAAAAGSGRVADCGEPRRRAAALPGHGA